MKTTRSILGVLKITLSLTGRICTSTVVPLLLLLLTLAMTVTHLTAQVFTTLHSFTALSVPNYGTNSDGVSPNGLILSGNTLYGTASLGGSGCGTVFAVNTDGTGFTTLHSFGSYEPWPWNGDGASPEAGLLLSGNTLYGTAAYGGWSDGAIFKVNTDGTGFMTLYFFTSTTGLLHTNIDGANPMASLVLSGSNLYGTALRGGFGGFGTVFNASTNFIGCANLHNFKGGDGAYPQAGLFLSGNILYGTTTGGHYLNGTVFKVNTDGTGFTDLHNFTPSSTNSSGVYTNSDGAYPMASLALSGNTLYGTALYGGSSGNGTVFKINTDGTGFTTLHSFTGSSVGPTAHGTLSGLALSGNTLYGTAYYIGDSNNGSVFKVNTDGTGFTTLHSFTALSVPNYGTNSDGAYPSGLILSGSTLYGTAQGGGGFGNGTVFSLSFPPQLTLIPSGPYVVLTWPTNVAGFDYTGYSLQSTTNLDPPVVWTTNSPPPVVLNGQNTVTNPISGTQQYFRLNQ